MIRIRKNTVKLSGIIALFCLSLACFTYINSIEFQSKKVPDNIYVEDLETQNPEVLPDVELIKRLVRKAFEFMSLSNL
ncbi:MAG TPA: hypothetical protein VMZ69_01370 [Saprospiraceae bacterium]|nr:hypothetical protein [Saprospiraceae bacterium]